MQNSSSSLSSSPSSPQVDDPRKARQNSSKPPSARANAPYSSPIPLHGQPFRGSTGPAASRSRTTGFSDARTRHVVDAAKGNGDEVLPTADAERMARGNQVDSLHEARRAPLAMDQDGPTRSQERQMGHQASSPTSTVGSKGVPASHEPSTSPVPPGSNTTSVESGKTVKGSPAPAISNHSTRTSSYPFPTMATPRHLNPAFHKPFTALSPTAAPSMRSSSTQDESTDRLASGSLTPASTMTFLPPGESGPPASVDYPTPDLYDLTLRLNSEPGLEAWWLTVVEAMRDAFKADRVTLALPADTTDLENVPWGQKATYNATEGDGYSLTYLQQGDLVPSSQDSESADFDWDVSSFGVGSPPPPASRLTRPNLDARHSFTGFERQINTADKKAAGDKSGRPNLLRTRSHMPTASQKQTQPYEMYPPALDSDPSLQYAGLQQSQPPDLPNTLNPSLRRDPGRVFPVLQSLDYEAHPLIDSSGVLKVLQRGKVVVLSREYTDPTSSQPYARSQHKSTNRTEVSTANVTPTAVPDLKGHDHPSFPSQSPLQTSSIKGPDKREKGAIDHSDDVRKEPSSHRLPIRSSKLEKFVWSPYEEFEQFPSSPWSQSPAPSPAVRNESAENPFFVTGGVDEKSFSPSSSTHDYTSHRSVEAIGFENSRTVVHIPLVHPLLSRPVNPPRLESMCYQANQCSTSAWRDETHNGTRHDSHPTSNNEKKTPIAVLSILSPVTPFPSNLVHSLSHLAPHLATSFSLARHYTNIETEAAGLARRRHRPPDQAGYPFGIAGGHRLEDLANLDINYASRGGGSLAASLSGSMTSPSEYSSISRGSPGGSLVATPNWDLSAPVERRSGESSGQSPGPELMDGYFQTKQKQHLGRSESLTLRTTRNSASRQGRPPTLHSNGDPKPGIGAEDPRDHEIISEKPSETLSTPTKRQRQPDMFNTSNPDKGSGDLKSTPKARVAKYLPSTSPESSQLENNSSSRFAEHDPSSRRHAVRNVPSELVSGQGRRHTMLHSYGADFNATFQSLPATGMSVPRSSGPPKRHSRAPSDTSPALIDLLPPSERLLRTIVDALPVQIFTAAPQNGAITWVNSKFLTYRGHTDEDVVKQPWHSIHGDQREDYLKTWNQSLRTGEPFSYQARLRRFDGMYRWFYVRAAPLRDSRGIIVHWFGTNMDIHEQHIAEVDAARQHETAASEAKYRSLANSSPQIVFAATENEGVTFANTQWLSYSGQRFAEALGFGFAEHVHPEDFSKCKLPLFGDLSEVAANVPTSLSDRSLQAYARTASGDTVNDSGSTAATVTSPGNALSRSNSSDSSNLDMATSQLSGLAKTGILKVTQDGDGKISYSTEVRLKSKGGAYRWHLVRCTMVDSINFGSGDGQWFGTCTDINDHKILEQKMKETMDSKTRFLSNMSHEIRTPLIGISGMVEFLSDTVLNAEQTDYCSTIRSSSDGLLDIVNDILDLSKIEAGMMTLSFDWFCIRSMIESVNDAVSSVAIKKRLELNFVVEEDVPLMVKGDQARIRQVLMNVLGNAVKFTSQGEIFTQCQVCKDTSASAAEDSIMLSFEVVDSGQGFSQKEAELIFKPFSQIDGSSTRRHGGSGLGLVISRQLVELHGGKMTGTSEPGKGSVFKFVAKFSIPTEKDYPNPEALGKVMRRSSSHPAEGLHPLSPGRAPSDLLLAKVLTQSPPVVGPSRDTGEEICALESSGSSDPSIRSYRTAFSEKSSISSIGPSATSSRDPSNIKLRLPETSGDTSSPTSSISSRTPNLPSSDLQSANVDHALLHPPMYSVLVICPHPYSLKAITRHIEMTLPKDIPHQITPRSSLLDGQQMIGGDDPLLFTHVVVNLSDPEEVIDLLKQTFHSTSHRDTTWVILADAGMRNSIKKCAPELDFGDLERGKRVRFLHKPVKPSRFADIFDPGKERTSSMDRNRSHAERAAENQKLVFTNMEKNVGNKGHKILLVEDNMVNQKVLRKFLDKVGMDVETVFDGAECTNRVLKEDHDFFSLILCDLHMPNKDGYQTCKEIRRWERKMKYPYLPIIALSANVMADVVDRCIEAGFSNYVTKPVDFKALSKAMMELLEPADRTKPHQLMRHRA
ncbi:MAG: hypothetical protein M1837_007165 [Sclerophora amabilis]|nr:MAG: hypothetical protein M1837_007165 [Sclerophora amabilis]